ncbi:flagellar hook-length control protein FliK [Clostridium felsineum]|uniref:flagellar hook-length control protein FliK n=1 Tax=Clostridium felsineum TaxID=36839 RepID=UPI00098CBD58|nr:flagellar hook-length control protein FliK [Clostridium felsineum]URZ00918.1 hypothetical protein CLAUR_009060 [Clostridium felsineum]
MVMVNVKGIGISEKDSYEFKSNNSNNSKNTSFEDVLKVKSSQNDAVNKYKQDDSDSETKSKIDKYSDKESNDSKNVEADKSKTTSNKDTNVSKKINKDESTEDDKTVKLKHDLENLLNDVKGDNGTLALIKQMLQMVDQGNGQVSDDKFKSAMKMLGISDEVQEKIMKVVHDVKEMVKNNPGLDFIKTLQDTVGAALSSDSSDQKKLVSDIVDVLKKKLRNDGTTENNLVNSNKVNVEDNESSNEGISNILMNSTKNEGNTKASENTENQTKSGDSKDFLKNLISKDDKSETQFSKVTAFMNQFNSTSGAAEVQGDSKVMTANKVTFVEDIIKSVKFMENNNIKELTVKINPKELGEVIIRVTSEAGVMKAELTTANKDAYNLLNANLKDMNSSLNNQDLKIQAFSLNVYNEDTTFFSGQGNDSKDSNKENQKNAKENSVMLDSEEDDTSNASEDGLIGRLNMLA